MTQELIKKQADEILRLRFALYGCLFVSKQTSPYLYSAALEMIQREAHYALYGDTVPFDIVERPIATYMRNTDAELTKEVAG